jgi:hypothetical protein
MSCAGNSHPGSPWASDYLWASVSPWRAAGCACLARTRLSYCRPSALLPSQLQRAACPRPRLPAVAGPTPGGARTAVQACVMPRLRPCCWGFGLAWVQGLCGSTHVLRRTPPTHCGPAS